MRQTNTRIGRVRIKGGPEITILRYQRDTCENDLHNDLAEAYKAIVEDHGSKMSGYCFVLWDQNGHGVAGFNVLSAKPISVRLVPIYAHQILCEAITRFYTKND